MAYTAVVTGSSGFLATQLVKDLLEKVAPAKAYSSTLRSLSRDQTLRGQTSFTPRCTPTLIAYTQQIQLGSVADKIGLGSAPFQRFSFRLDLHQPSTSSTCCEGTTCS